MVLMFVTEDLVNEDAVEPASERAIEDDVPDVVASTSGETRAIAAPRFDTDSALTVQSTKSSDQVDVRVWGTPRP